MRAAHRLEVFYHRAGNEDEGEPDDDHGEGGRIPDEKGHQPADDASQGEPGQQRPSERHVRGS